VKFPFRHTKTKHCSFQSPKQKGDIVNRETFPLNPNPQHSFSFCPSKFSLLHFLAFLLKIHFLSSIPIQISAQSIFSGHVRTQGLVPFLCNPLSKLHLLCFTKFPTLFQSFSFSPPPITQQGNPTTKT